MSAAMTLNDSAMRILLAVFWAPSALGRLHSGLMQQCRGFGRRHELDQLASHILILRDIAHGDAEVAVFDKVWRQRAEILSAGDRLDHVGLLDADLDFTVSDCDRNGLALDDFDLALDLVVDAQLLKHSRVVRAGARVTVADRPGVEHRLLEPLG